MLVVSPCSSAGRVLWLVCFINDIICIWLMSKCCTGPAKSKSMQKTATKTRVPARKRKEAVVVDSGDNVRLPTTSGDELYAYECSCDANACFVCELLRSCLTEALTLITDRHTQT